MSKSDKGFSLLEVVITLSIVSSCVLLFSFALSQVRSTRAAVKDDRQIEWHLFINQLETDLVDNQDVRTGRDKLSFTKFNPERQKLETITYERYYKLVRRQVDVAGHQPLLLEVSAVSFSVTESRLTISVTFENGESYNASLRVNAKGLNS